MSEDTNEWLQGAQDDFDRRLHEYVQRQWLVQEEVSGTGTLITRARHRTHPIEVINGERGMYELLLN